MSTDTNLSAVLYGVQDLRMEDRPIPEPGRGDVQIAVHSVGICGSDVTLWKLGAIGPRKVTKPTISGHESSGTVTKLGEGVTHLKVGDRVAVEPGVPCRICEFCKTGRYNLCPNHMLLSIPPEVHGALCRYHVHPADFCFKLPDHVTFEEGALLEPLSVAVHACKRAEISLGHKVLICGAGTIGLMNLITAKAMGAAEVCVTDLSEYRLGVAKKMGANHIVHVTTKDAKVVAKKVQDALGCMPDKTIECSGAEASIQTGIYATKSGGTMVVVGIGPEEVKIPIVNAACREVDIRGTFAYVNTYPTALAMIASGAVDPKPIVTHHFPLEEALQAFNTSMTGEGGAIKVIIDCFKKAK